MSSLASFWFILDLISEHFDLILEHFDLILVTSEQRIKTKSLILMRCSWNLLLASFSMFCSGISCFVDLRSLEILRFLIAAFRFHLIQVVDLRGGSVWEPKSIFWHTKINEKIDAGKSIQKELE